MFPKMLPESMQRGMWSAYVRPELTRKAKEFGRKFLYGENAASEAEKRRMVFEKLTSFHREIPTGSAAVGVAAAAGFFFGTGYKRLPNLSSIKDRLGIICKQKNGEPDGMVDSSEADNIFLNEGNRYFILTSFNCTN